MKKLLLVLLLVPSICLASWECINRNVMVCNTWRWEVPGGWLVEGDHGDENLAMTFFPDPEHKWDGK